MELEAHQPQLLYYTALPRRWLKIFSWFLRLRGHDPTAIGRNKDIDLTHLGYPQENLHTAINYSPYWDIKMRASAAHASQGGGGMNRLLPAWLQNDYYPPTPIFAPTRLPLTDSVTMTYLTVIINSILFGPDS